MPMQPRPRDETCRPDVPNVRVSMVVLLRRGQCQTYPDLVRELGGDDAGLAQRDAYVGEHLLPQRLRPAVHAPLGGGVHAVAGAGISGRSWRVGMSAMS